MRKNTARHWLHATLDLLPVILIPVFMIYSHRHDLISDITIQQDVYKDFYQGVKNGKPTSLNYWTSNNVTIDYINNAIEVEADTNLYTEVNNINVVADNIYISFCVFSRDTCYISTYLNNGDLLIFEDYEYNEINSIQRLSYINTVNQSTLNNLEIDVTSVGDNVYISNVMLFDLTTIFGSGNEPTKEEFESYLTQDYYDFGSNQVKVGTIDVQAKNNDIMSVFMDSFNNSIDRYFNMGNVFNMTSVYNWFNTNIFGGTAPVVIYSVWNIVLYEFVMDLLFLLYGLFMWFIDMCQRLMEKPLDSIK